ncbi:hypothetical protein [Metapseudomonas otitidis]|uniref:hypothetical protein n=1 Tax=Metapseudomonas otitidis TaxID=319939 RepID=UPI0013F60649|nr:hypothetical protein [Pseudomonas otitidis]MDG9783706.1 hypothetical protein [Pseudomonas otitidis]
MKLTKYIYKGPRSSASLRVGEDVLDVQLNPGKPANLPADHEYTEVLLQLQYLELAPAEKAATEKGGK